ncbi:MAG: hypothetical protein ACYTBJ_05320 [Planctomycetota bacterium]|jgi:hypothetical protein
MSFDPLSFFISKIAKDDPKKVIDPGEAAAAGLALASGTVAQTVIPTAISMATGQIGPKIVPWTGASMHGLRRLKPVAQMSEVNRGIAKLHELGVDPHDVNFLNNPRYKALNSELQKYVSDKATTTKLMDLFDIRMSPRGDFSDKALRSIEKSYKTIDSMIDKYKLSDKGLKIDLTSGPLAKVRGPAYFPRERRISLPEVDKNFILHEIGHAAHETRKGAGAFRTMRNIFNRGAVMSVPMAYLAGNEIQKMLPGTVDDKVIGFVQENAPAIMASAWAAAEVYPEVQATTRAVSHVYKTEGAAAARKTLKALLPPMAGYVLPIIPALVGVALAKKYYFKAKGESLEKKSGVLSELWETGAGLASEAASIGGQVGTQASTILRKPAGEVAKILLDAGVKTVKSPSFVSGAVTAGIPAATWAYVYHNTPHGKIYRKNLASWQGKQFGPLAKAENDLQEIKARAKDDTATWPAIVGIGAAVAGGFLSKFWADIARTI